MSVWRRLEPCFKGIWAFDPPCVVRMGKRNAANRHLEIPANFLVMGLFPFVFVCAFSQGFTGEREMTGLHST